MFRAEIVRFVGEESQREKSARRRERTREKTAKLNLGHSGNSVRIYYGPTTLDIRFDFIRKFPIGTFSL